MLNNLSKQAIAIIAFSLVSITTQAAITENEAKRLTQDLTPVGAERGANKSGSIPAWTGGLVVAPDGYQSGDFMVDPFASEKPIFTITAQNVDQYKANLTAGQLAMFKKYPAYTMPVYPTHRTAGYPQAVNESTIKHAITAQLIEEGNGVSGRGLNAPFPVPQNGLEAIWNHLTRYRGYSMERTIVQVPVFEQGDFVENRFVDQWVFPENFKAGRDLQKDENVLAYFLQQILSPPQLTGNILLVHETLNQVKQPRKAWRYNTGQRRVRRAPQVAYDGPGTGAEGLRTVDNYDMYNGAPDRYEWKLIGKKELYIPYNAYKLQNPDLTYKTIHQAGHIDQSLTRYELHRVWEVEATLKNDARHVYAKRVFFLDEDTWQAAVIDHYDARDELWRLAEAHAVQYYENEIPFYSVETLYDLQSGRYLTTGLSNEEDKPWQFNLPFERRQFQPAALRRMGRR